MDFSSRRHETSTVTTITCRALIDGPWSRGMLPFRTSRYDNDNNNNVSIQGVLLTSQVLLATHHAGRTSRSSVHPVSSCISPAHEPVTLQCWAKHSQTPAMLEHLKTFQTTNNPEHQRSGILVRRFESPPSRTWNFPGPPDPNPETPSHRELLSRGGRGGSASLSKVRNGDMGLSPTSLDLRIVERLTQTRHW